MPLFELHTDPSLPTSVPLTVVNINKFMNIIRNIRNIRARTTLGEYQQLLGWQ